MSTHTDHPSNPVESCFQCDRRRHQAWAIAHSWAKRALPAELQISFQPALVSKTAVYEYSAVALRIGYHAILKKSYVLRVTGRVRSHARKTSRRLRVYDERKIGNKSCMPADGSFGVNWYSVRKADFFCRSFTTRRMTGSVPNSIADRRQRLSGLTSAWETSCRANTGDIRYWNKRVRLPGLSTSAGS